MEDLPYPADLEIGIKSMEELSARIGRYAVLMELGFFGEQTNLKIAQGGYKGRFNAAVRKHFSGIYGNTEGCGAGDIEVAAELLDVFDDIYDYESSNARTV